MFIPTSIKIAILNSHPNKEGEVPIILRYTQNRKPKNIRLKKFVPPSCWINKGSKFLKERGNDALPNARQINYFLNQILQKGERIILQAESENSSLTFEQFKEQMISTKDQNFIKFCEEELSRRKDSGKFSIETIRSHRSKLNKLKGFRRNIAFNDFTPAFLKDYESYMRNDKGNSTNTIFTSMKFLRTMLNAAINQNCRDVYPFKHYKLKFEKNTRDRLYINEVELLQKLYDSEVLSKKLQSVLRYFLFVCYTGLSWKDLCNLDYAEIKDLNGVFVISKKRHKTKMEFSVPLLQEAKNLIDLQQKKGTVFPDIISNQKANLYIKEVIKQTSIGKSISFHCGRHSFGTISLNKGIPREVVQKMLGHESPEMTDVYSKVLDSYIITEMNKWKNGIASSDFKENLSEGTLKSCKNIRRFLISNRIASGYSEIQIAEKLGLSEQDYKNIEMGESQLGVGYLIEISKVLAFNIGDVLR